MRLVATRVQKMRMSCIRCMPYAFSVRGCLPRPAFRPSQLQSDSVSLERQRNSRRPPRQADFSMSVEDLRSVVVFTSAAAEVVLPHFELWRPDDDRPRQALTAALAFVRGDPRSKAQRVSAPATHRARREAESVVAFHAAMAVGDAAASAYLHPLAVSAQVKHILRAPAHAVRVLELTVAQVGNTAPCPPLERFESYSTSRPIDVLRRYPRIGTTPSRPFEKSNRISDSTNRINHLIAELDEWVRERSTANAERP